MTSRRERLGPRWRWAMYERVTGRRMYDHLDRIEREQFLPREEIETLQRERLRDILEHAAQNVPYYRDLFRKIGFLPGDVRSVGDLAQLPVLERETIRDEQNRLIADTVDRSTLHSAATSGTTGTPIAVYFDRDAWMQATARHWRAHLAWGYKPGERILRLRRGPERETWKLRLHRSVRAIAARDYRIQIELLGREGLARTAAEIRSWRPRFLHGFRSLLELMAAYLEHEGRRCNVPVVISGGELLTGEGRKRLTDWLGLDVLEYYSSNETMGFGFECEAHRGIHLSTDAFVVEALVDGRPAQPGELAEIVVTTLTNRAMPLIRYRLGDTIVPVEGECPCGRGFPLINITHGRVVDIISTPDGRHLPPNIFMRLFWSKGVGVVKQFQVVQESLERLRVRIVRMPDYSSESERVFLDEIQYWMGEGVEIEFEYVDDIPLSARGKSRITESAVPIRFNPKTD